jgi:hypothetical protein
MSTNSLETVLPLLLVAALGVGIGVLVALEKGSET